MTEATMEGGEAGLAEWLAGHGRDLREAVPLSGDVSPRRYARLRFADGSTGILASYPDEVRSTCPRFLRTTALLEGAGVRVPRVLAVDCDRGWMLVEDLGPRTLAEWQGSPWSELTPYFEEAVRLARRIAELPAEVVGDMNPPLDRELMARELRQTWDLFLEPRGLTGDPDLATALRDLLDELCANLAAEPTVVCHRDFMARNLMPAAGPPQGGRLVVLDHQDLRLGPPAYDVASLLNDTLFPPPAVEEALLRAALPPGEEHRLRYHRAAAQRTLKAVGTYASFARRGAPRHLPLIPGTLARSLEHLARTPEGAPLAPRLSRAWGPVLPPATS